MLKFLFTCGGTAGLCEAKANNVPTPVPQCGTFGADKCPAASPRCRKSEEENNA